MSAKERDRLKVLHEVRKRHITQKQAATELGLSVRWVRKLLLRLRARGDSALRHGLRGRSSNRKTPEAVKRRALELYREKKQAKLWHDYGPTLAAEELAEQHGIAISRETLRRWLIEAKLWRRRRAGMEQAHVWRARRARYGELVQWDTSEHDWLEGRGEKLYLIAMIDDATSQLSARFVRHDSSEENLQQLRHYNEQQGRPVSVYTDKASLFQIAPRAIHHREAPAEQLSQIGRALKELNIEWIAAHSPQAKGRIERAFQTAQDRLVKGLRQVGANDLDTGQHISPASLSTALQPALSAPAATGRRRPPCSTAGNESRFGAEHSGEPYGEPGLHGSLGECDLSGQPRTNCPRHAGEPAWPWSDGSTEAGGCTGETEWSHWNAVKPGHP
jgi:transposase